MAQRPNIFAIPTAHIDGTPATLVNQVIGGVGIAAGTSRFIPALKYVPSQTSLQGTLNVPNAAIIARIYIPEPLVGMTTVTITQIDDQSTGWTGGN